MKIWETVLKAKELESRRVNASAHGNHQKMLQTKTLPSSGQIIDIRENVKLQINSSVTSISNRTTTEFLNLTLLLMPYLQGWYHVGHNMFK